MSRMDFFNLSFEGYREYMNREKLPVGDIDDLVSNCTHGLCFTDDRQREALSVLNRWALMMLQGEEDSTHHFKHISSLLWLVRDFIAVTHLYSRYFQKTDILGLVDIHLAIKDLEKKCDEIFKPFIDAEAEEATHD